MGAVAATLTLLAKQQPAGDIDAQDMIDVISSALTKDVVLIHLDSLKSSGQYDHILSESRSASAEGGDVHSASFRKNCE